MKKLYFLCVVMLLSFSYGIAQTNLYNTNFDALTAGGLTAQQLGAPWTTWSLAPGGAEDALVSITQSHSSPNSVGVILNDDLIFGFNDRTTGRYKVGFWMYVATGKLGYYNFLSDFNGGSSKWAFQVMIYNDSIFVDAGGTTAAKTTYAFNTWNKMDLIIDLDDDFATFLINDIEIISYQWSKGAQGTDNTLKLDAIDFFGWDGTGSPTPVSGTAGYFIDDLTWDSVAAPNAPSNLTANLNGSDIDVAWTAPTPTPDGYKLSRNGIVEYSGTGLAYTDPGPWPNTYIYGARAYYTGSGYSHSSNTDTVTVPGGVARNLVLMEKGTSTNCTYCPGAAMGFRDLIEVNNKDAVGVAYHPTNTFGGSFGDAYGTTTSDTRLAYYGLGGYPTVWGDGIFTVVGGSATASMYQYYLPIYNERIAVPSFQILNIDVAEISVNNYTATIIIEETYKAYASGWKLHTALTESSIAVNWGNQTELDNVCRGMYPSASGTTLDFSTQTKDTITLNFSSAGFVKNNCEFVVFVQHNPSKLVTQTSMIEMSTVIGIEELQGNKISMYPNPAENYVTLLTSGKGIIDIFDLTGRLVSSTTIHSSTQSIDISGLNKGIYVVKVSNSDKNFTEKLIVD